MREQLLDLLERLVAIRATLGEEAFGMACHKARVAIGKVVLEEATAAAERVRSSRSHSGEYDNLPLTTTTQDDTFTLL